MRITWTTKSGKTITATPDRMMPATWLHVTVDGAKIDNGYLIPITDKRAASVAAQLAAAGTTHVMICGKIPVGVSTAVAAEIQAAQQAAANRPPSLKSQREELVAAVQGAGDAYAAARESFFAEDTGRVLNKVHQAEAAIRTAEKALTDFDIAHPQVVAAIKAEQDEATARFLRAD